MMRAANARRADRLEALQQRMVRALNRRLEERRTAVSALWKVAASLDPRAVLGRGYALVRDAGGHVVTDAARVAPGQALQVEVAAGSFSVIVEGGKRDGAMGEPARSAARSAPKRSAAPSGGQGDLF